MDISEHRKEIIKLVDDLDIFSPIVLNGQQLVKYSVSKYGVVMNNENKIPVAQWECSNGRYLSVNLYIDHDCHKIMVHRLVAEAFCANDDPMHKTEGNHIDGNGHNNIWTNLEWTSHLGNVAHTINMGRNICGSSHHRSNYSEAQIHSVCRMLEQGLTPAEIYKKTGVNIGVVRGIRNGMDWKHISKQHSFIRGESNIILRNQVDVDAYRMLESGSSPKEVRDFILSNKLMPDKSVPQIYSRIKTIRRAIIHKIPPTIIG